MIRWSTQQSKVLCIVHTAMWEKYFFLRFETKLWMHYKDSKASFFLMMNIHLDLYDTIGHLLMLTLCILPGRFASLATRVLINDGIPVYLFSHLCPTPYVVSRKCVRCSNKSTPFEELSFIVFYWQLPYIYNSLDRLNCRGFLDS